MTASHLAWPPDASAAHCYARPFALLGDDLGIDLALQAAVPATITALLAGCVQDAERVAPTAERAWQWSVPRRREGLLAVVYATVGANITALARCDEPRCSQRIELDLELTSFVSAGAERIETDVEGQRLVCRMPTGDDLRAWALEGAYRPAWLAERIVIAIDERPKPDQWRLPESWVAPIAAALEAADPLAALTVDVSCPFCDHVFAVALDLESLLLGTLRDVARETREDVHQLARAYHWSESDILGMPAARRRAYLARLVEDHA